MPSPFGMSGSPVGGGGSDSVSTGRVVGMSGGIRGGGFNKFSSSLSRICSFKLHGYYSVP